MLYHSVRLLGIYKIETRNLKTTCFVITWEQPQRNTTTRQYGVARVKRPGHVKQKNRSWGREDKKIRTRSKAMLIRQHLPCPATAAANT